MINGPEHLEHVAVYKPGASVEEIKSQYGLTDVEKLASNENPLGPSPMAVIAATKALASANIYGDGGAALREKLAQHHDLSTEAITVNSGSDAIIHQIMRSLLLPGETALSCYGTFVSFGIAVKTVGRTPHFVSLADGYRFDVEALAAAITPNTKIVYIANPNNPTGTYITQDEVSWLVERLPSTTLLVLDEAYFEYASFLKPDTYPDGIALHHPNVLSLRTFSKAYGMAGFRIGYAVGAPNVIGWLRKVKLPFSPNSIGCAAAIAAIDDVDHVQRTVELNAKGLDILGRSLRKNGFKTTDSIANFVMVDCGGSEVAQQFHLALLQEGCISRPLPGFGLPNCVRISTGTAEQNDRLAATLGRLAETIVTD